VIQSFSCVSYVPHLWYSRPQRHVVVKLLARGKQWTLGTPVEVVHGEVRIGKELNSLQNLLKEWFYTCAVIGITLIFVFEVMLWTTMQVSVHSRRQQQQQQHHHHEQEASMEEDNPHDALDMDSAGYEIFHDDDDEEWDEMPPPQDANDAAHRTPNLANDVDEGPTSLDNDPSQWNLNERTERGEESNPSENETLNLRSNNEGPFVIPSVE
jgi:flagellar biosynthesis/type III secretory pathway M-ring protein FliF/YscJ